jgi:hypothetical protein
MRKPAAVKTTSAVPAKRAAPAAAKSAVKPAAKAAVKPPAKPAAKPAARPAVKTAAVKPPAKAAKKAAPPPPKAARKGPAKPAPAEAVREKAKKARLVRDSFTMPEHEYEVIGQVKKSCLKAGFEIKKSELLRIGVALISQLDLATLQNVLASLPQLKTGRPKKV